MPPPVRSESLSTPAPRARTRAEVPLLRGTKVARIVKHCVFEISTGAWPVGHRLPSLRSAERIWSVNHLTVLRAYRRLEELGLAYSRPRSGFYVAEHAPSERARERQEVLEDVYEDICSRLEARGLLSTVGAFRHLAQLAESRARQRPECAFVECTQVQADEHAREVEARLQLPCRPLTLRSFADAAVREPLRVALTTGFHRAEVVAAAGDAVEVLTVAIELAPSCAQSLESAGKRVLFLALDGDTAAHIARDASGVLPRLSGGGRRPVESQACDPRDLDKTLSAATGPTVVLSPSLWEVADRAWRDSPSVHRLTYRVTADSWSEVAAALGVGT